MNIQRGNPYTAVLTFTDNDGSAYDLTGKTVFFTIKLSSDVARNDDAALIKVDITEHTDATGGITTLSLTAAQTTLLDVKRAGYYKADFRIYQDGVVQTNTTTIYPEIDKIVTERTS